MAGVFKFGKYIIAALLLIVIINVFLIQKTYEGLDTPPEHTAVTFKLTDKSTFLTDPNPIGTFYVFTDTNTKLKNKVNMVSDPSDIELLFDTSKPTNLIICPTQMPVNKPHKANMFPKTFAIDYTFKESSKKFTLLNQDASDNNITNSIVSYVSPGGDVSGNFMNITIGKQFGQPLKNNTGTQIGNATTATENVFNISMTDSTGIDGILLTYSPPA